MKQQGEQVRRAMISLRDGLSGRSFFDSPQTFSRHFVPVKCNARLHRCRGASYVRCLKIIDCFKSLLSVLRSDSTSPPFSDSRVSPVWTSYIDCSIPSENEMDGFVAEGVFVEFFCSPLDAVVSPLRPIVRPIRQPERSEAGS